MYFVFPFFEIFINVMSLRKNPRRLRQNMKTKLNCKKIHKENSCVSVYLVL